MQVNRIATMQIESVRPDEPILDVAERMKLSEVGFLPVVEHGKAIGVVTDRDIALRVVADGLDPKKTHTRQIMSAQVLWIYEDAEVEDAIRLMAEKAVRRLLIKDHQGLPAGVLSLDDLAVFTHGDETTGRVLQRIAEASPSPSAFRNY